MFATDGSMSMVRQDDEASNSGLLDLDPMLPMARHGAPARHMNIGTPVLGPQSDVQLLQLPPLRGKSKRPPRRSSLDAPWPQPSLGAPRSVSDTRASSGESNRSVIIHEESPPTKWQQSPEKSVPDDPAPAAQDAPAARLPARMRRWMHDAMKQHMYETAIFWGRHVVALERTYTPPDSRSYRDGLQRCLLASAGLLSYAPI